MTRKRYKKNRAKTPMPAYKHPARNNTPAPQILLNQIAIGGEDYLKQNFIQIMVRFRSARR